MPNVWQVTSPLLIGLIVFGCVAHGPAMAIAASSPTMTDPQITDAVGDALFTKHGVPGYVIDVRTNEGIVTMSGTVNNIMAKERAVRVAETVKGVRSVVDRIKVADAGRSDEEVRDDVRAALLMDPATDSWEITATVDHGMVTLSGTVESWQEKRLAAKVAKSVRGVRGLNNKIDINYKMNRSDSEIRAEIVEALRWNALVDHALVDVRVQDGNVMLSGTVGSAAERRRARIDAWVTGVNSVNTSNLNVESWARSERFRKDKYVRKSDEQIRDAVKDALLYDPRVASFNVNVSVDNGVVRLNGEVDNLKAKRSAARTARNTVGVWRVKNRIDVRPSTPSDATIAQNIREALRRDPYVERFEVSVYVNNGEANLSGTVDTYFEKFQAGDAAAGVYGVVVVDNNLLVDDDYDVFTYDPYVDDDWYIYDYDWYVYPNAYTSAKTDWEIREDVQDELYWSPFVDSDKVTVTVDDGAATLTGVVDTWNERQAASENAYEGGAVAVDNDLSVHYGPDYYEP
jgi:osmotically-inducible protein OsmY